MIKCRSFFLFSSYSSSFFLLNHINPIDQPLNHPPFLPAHLPHLPPFTPRRFDDATLLRFLRARKFNLQLAKDMWAANEEWRVKFGTDEIAR